MNFSLDSLKQDIALKTPSDSVNHLFSVIEFLLDELKKKTNELERQKYTEVVRYAKNNNKEYGGPELR